MQDLFSDVAIETPAKVVAECVNDDCPFTRQPRARDAGEALCGFCKFPLVGSVVDGG